MTAESRISEIDRIIAELTAERRTLLAADRLAQFSAVSAGRRASLERAVELGAEDGTLSKLAEAPMLRQRDSLRVKTRFGKAWGRSGSGDAAEWAEKDGGVVYLTPGEWTVGSNDGFNRKESPTEWSVEHVTVGDETWTVGY